MTHNTLRLLYALAFGSLGAILPYLAVELEEAGLTTRSLGIVLLAFPVGRLISGPLAAWLADRYRLSARLLSGAWALAAVSILLVAHATTVVGATTALLGYTLSVTTFGPILDGVATALLGSERASYGRIRLWGSMGFLVMVLLGGMVRDHLGLSPLGLGSILLAIAAVRAALLRDVRTAPPPPILPALVGMLRSPGMVLLMVAAMLHTITLTGYDLLFASHVVRLGLPTRVAGWAMALGVAVEVMLMAASPFLLRRVGTEKLLSLAIAAGVLRWGLTAMVTEPWAVVAVQSLHGVTFGLFWVAAIHLISSRAEPGVEASSQSVFYLACWGVGGLVAVPLATEVMAAWGSQVMFGVFAGVSVLGVGVLLAAYRARIGAEALRQGLP